MTFEYVPFGNAFYAIDSCKKYTYPDTRFCWANTTYASKPTDDSVFDGKLVCQHGPTECYDNVLEMCVIKYEPDWKKYTPWLQCYEGAVESGATTPATALKCAAEAGIDITKAVACSHDTTEATALTHATARKTCALQPEHKFTPWIVINGVACGLDGTGCHGLLERVCKIFTGTKPVGCPKQL